MSEYTPDNWLLFKLPKNAGYKVLGGWWSGGRWRFNSGVTRITMDKDFYYFHGYSGSVYKCQRMQECASVSMVEIVGELEERGAVCVPMTQYIMDEVND